MILGGSHHLVELIEFSIGNPHWEIAEWQDLLQSVWVIQALSQGQTDHFHK